MQQANSYTLPSVPTPLDEAAVTVRDSSATIARCIARPGAHEVVSKRAGVNLDKVSEVVMACLTGEGNLELRLSDLANRLGVELSSVSRKVQKLEDAGLVKKSPDPTDARAFRLHLTPQGQETIDALANARFEIFREVLTSWSADDRTQLAALFDRFSSELTTHMNAQREA